MVGQVNILNKARHGEIVPGTLLPAKAVKYLRPVPMKRGVVDRVMRGTWPSKAAPIETIPGDEGRRPASSINAVSDGIRKIVGPTGRIPLL